MKSPSRLGLTSGDLTMALYPQLIIQDLYPSVGEDAIPPDLPTEFCRHLREAPAACASILDQREELGGVEFLRDHLWLGGIAEVVETSPYYDPDCPWDQCMFRRSFRRGVGRTVERISDSLQWGYSWLEQAAMQDGYHRGFQEQSLLRALFLYWDLNVNGSKALEDRRNILEPYIVSGYLLELYLLEYIRQRYSCLAELSTPEQDWDGVDLSLYDLNGYLLHQIGVTRGWYRLRTVKGVGYGDIVEFCIGGGYGRRDDSDGIMLWDTCDENPPKDTWVALVADLLLYMKNPQRWSLPREKRLDRMLKKLGLKEW